ncbi:MAG: hypothetical protein SGI74_09775 [Oligoflexia bacterium]|nr:hypothetical protein [Oligoflexia bacterium]
MKRKTRVKENWLVAAKKKKFILLRYFILAIVFGSLASGYTNCAPVGFNSVGKLPASAQPTGTTSTTGTNSTGTSSTSTTSTTSTTSSTSTTSTTTGVPCNPPRVVVNGQCVCPGTTPDSAFCITAQCFWNQARTQPTVAVSWCQNPYPGTTPNSNSIEKGDSFPSDPEKFWAFLFMDNTPFSTYALADSNVAFGGIYKYRAKYRPELAGREIEITLNSCTCP